MPACIACILAWLVASSTLADARPGEPIVVVSTDAAFSAALDDALVAAGMELVAVGDVTSPPANELPATSRALADREGATATIWLLGAPIGSTLVTYDRGVDRVLVRELPYSSPLSATQAAEAARMVRTMLRALRVTTDSDQLPPPARAMPIGPEPSEPLLGASVSVGAWFAAPGDSSQPAATLAVELRPHGVGGALAATFAPPARVATSAFTGTVRDIAIGLEVRRSFVLGPALRIAPGLGAALHAIELEGSFSGGVLRSRRYDPALRLGVVPAYDVGGGLEVGLAVSADCLLRRQHYQAGSEDILVVPRVQVIAGVILGIRR